MPITDCITVEDVLDFKVNCQEPDICCPAETISENLEIAAEIVNIITGQDWCPESSCKRFDGSGNNQLYFNSDTALPLQTITSITDLSCCSPVTIDVADIDNFSHWIQFKCGGCFPCGSENIQVCGTWGKSMPAGIKKVIIMMTLELIQPGAAGLYNPNGIRSATWEDFRISYAVEERPRGDFTTGFQELDDILALYTNPLNQVSFSVVPESERCLPRDCGVVTKKNTHNCGSGSCQKCC